MKEANESSTQKIELGALFSRCLRGWYWFLLFGTVSGSLSWLFLQYQPALFDVGSKVFIQEDKKSDIVGSSVFGQSPLFTERFSLTNEVEVLKSRRLLEKVVRSLDIHINHYGEGRFIDQELYLNSPLIIEFSDSTEVFYGTEFRVSEIDRASYAVVLSEFDSNLREMVATDSIQGRYGVPQKTGNRQFTISRRVNYEGAISGTIKIVVNDPKALAKRYSTGLRIIPVALSEVLGISLTDNIPERSVAFLNKLIEVYNQEVLENKNRSTNKTLDFIDDRLEFITTELFTVENELEDFKRTNSVPLELSQSAVELLNKVSSNDEAVAEIELQQNLLDGIDQELKKNEESNDVLLINFQVDGQTPDVINEYNSRIQQRSRLLVSATPENPQVIALDAEIARVKTNLFRWITFKKGELEDQKTFLMNKVQPLSDKIDAIPKYEREMLQIMRQQVIKETLFTFLLQRREETAMTIASEVSNARFINDPIMEAQISPNRKKIYALGLFLGLGIPFMAMFLIEYFDNNIYSQKDIEQHTNAPILGEVIFAENAKSARIQKGGRSVVAETFRLLRTNLKYIAKGESNQSILITSSTSGEGKTFVSINLASTIAISGKSVVVVGMDLRKPKLAQYLIGQSLKIGVTNFLIGQENEIETLIHPVEGIENLFFIDSGPIPPNPNELIMESRATEFFNLLRKRFDYVIIDTPPVGLVADALSLKEHADASIYVAKFEYTKKAQLAIIEDIFQNQKLPNPSVVLNGVKKRVGRGYGGYSGYGYSYGYGYYEESDRTFWQKLKGKFKG